jgi:xylulokinase
VGGGARSETWLKIIASVLDRPLQVAADSEVGAALGAARLAICAAEGADPLEVCAAPAIRKVIEPEPALAAAYAEGYARYRRLYPALKSATGAA